MELNNFYERALWNEWKMRMKLFSHHTVRKQYYPHNMDTYYELEKKMVSLRREQIQNAKKLFDQLIEPDVRAAYYQLWKTKCIPIKKHDEGPIYWSSSDKINQFFDKLSVLENERLEFMYMKLSQLEAAKTLLELKEKLITEEKKKEALEKRKQTNEQRKKNVGEIRVRRSARLNPSANRNLRRGSIYENVVI